MYGPASRVPTRHRETLPSSLEIISSLALGISDDRSRFRCPPTPAACAALKKGTHVRWIFDVIRLFLKCTVRKRLQWSAWRLYFFKALGRAVFPFALSAGNFLFNLR